MASKKQQLKFLDDFYERRKEELYLGTNVVNIKKAQNRQEELFSLNEYLPNLLRGFLDINYYSRMEEAGVIDKVMEQMAKTRKQGREADVIEFINWIDTHKDFNDLLNEKKVKNLGDKLEELEKEYNALKKQIK
jgi:hypothetical protein